MTLSYDRRAPEALLSVLDDGGWAHSLVEYAQSGSYAMDLHFHGYADKPDHWATLYVGTTKVVDLYHRATKKGDERFKLAVHDTYATGGHGWQAEWSTWQPPESLAAKWPAVDDYLEKVIPRVRAAHLVEGVIQSAISRFDHPDQVPLRLQRPDPRGARLWQRLTRRAVRNPQAGARGGHRY